MQCGFTLPWHTGSMIIKDHFSFRVLQACYLRGLNSTHIAEERCRTWLGEWLQISCSLKGKINPYGHATKIQVIFVFYSKIILELIIEYHETFV